MSRSPTASSSSVVKQYAVRLIKQKEYKTRAQKQLREFEEAFRESKQECMSSLLPDSSAPAVHVQLGDACVVIRRKVSTQPGTFTQRRLDAVLSPDGSGFLNHDVLVEMALGVQRELHEGLAKERDKQEREIRKREREEAKVVREARKVSRLAMEQRVAQVKRSIQGGLVNE